MFTITLQIGCYEKGAVEQQLRSFISRKGWGKAKKPVLLSEDNGYFSYQVDVFAKDPEGMIYEIEMMSCGRIDIPPELGYCNFNSVAYRVSSIPRDVCVEDVVGMINQSFATTTLLRSTLINVMGRLEHLENIVLEADEIVNEPEGDESSNIEIEEGKVKWLH